jgi:hypothetical protein
VDARSLNQENCKNYFFGFVVWRVPDIGT